MQLQPLAAAHRCLLTGSPDLGPPLAEEEGRPSSETGESYLPMRSTVRSMYS
jgi:hypothetical protein